MLSSRGNGILKIALVIMGTSSGHFNLFNNITQILSRKYETDLLVRPQLPPFLRAFYHIYPLALIVFKNDLVISCNLHWSGAATALWAKIFRKKCMIFIMGRYWEEIKIKYGGKGIRKAVWRTLLSLLEFISMHLTDVIVAPDDVNNDYLMGEKSKRIIIEKKLGVVDTGQFHYDSKIKKIYKEKLGIALADPVILFIGHLSEWDGADSAINIYRRLYKEVNNLWLLFIGAGELEERIRKTIIDENLGKVILTGYIQYNQVQNYMMVGDVALLPMREPACGIGNVTLELMALGIPNIATDVGALREVIINGKTGFLVNNEVEMAEKVKYLITDTYQLKNMSRNARLIIEREYSLESCSNRFLFLVDRCMNHS